MDTTVTVRLDVKLDRMLRKLCKQTGRSRSEIVRDALRRQMTIEFYEHLRSKVLPFAEAKGYLIDEDVFRDVS
ncbi:MAG: CopG family transcriptional regulator [Gammaproteobacteria bacterium]|nr:CopG family transcriptional regulator [Gammaproteobacteria bacterium]